jgi:hypothetical protein
MKVNAQKEGCHGCEAYHEYDRIRLPCSAEKIWLVLATVSNQEKTGLGLKTEV